ncbi:hypothetical protein LENED_011289 [Lentinula edodes]|uniref:Uncharacterized protein n=1 Tax=Lentinula edodes TaxID=5353 RepID=A0A1Q3EPN1_LENED|nr:hypothetical protein LENED_011289 [Lentinula edodes]
MRLFIDILLDLFITINVIVNDTKNVNNNNNNNNNNNTKNVDINAHNAKPFRFRFTDAFAKDGTGAKEEERTRDHRGGGFIAYHPFTSPHLSPSHPNPTPGPFLLFEHDLNETHTRRWKLASRNERNIPRICPAPIPNFPTSLELQESMAQYIELELSVQELGTVFPQTKPICLHVVHRPSFLPQWTHRLPTDPPHHTHLPLSLTSTPSLLFKHDSLSECPGGNCWVKALNHPESGEVELFNA